MKTLLSIIVLAVSVNAMAIGVPMNNMFPPSTMKSDLAKKNAIKGAKQIWSGVFGKGTKASKIENGVYEVSNNDCSAVVSVSMNKPVVVTPETPLSCN